MSTNLPPDEQPKGSRFQPNNNMLIGLVVIVIGSFFLLRNFGIVSWEFEFNWWALLVLIPGGGILLSVWQEYQRNGEKFTRNLRNRLAFGAGIVMIAVMVITGLDWNRYWPLLLILGGAVLLLNVLGPAERRV